MAGQGETESGRISSELRAGVPVAAGDKWRSWEEKIRAVFLLTLPVAEPSVIADLRRAADNKNKLTMVHTVGGMAVGFLNKEEQWSIEVEDVPGAEGSPAERTPVLRAHFANVRTIDAEEIPGGAEDPYYMFKPVVDAPEEAAFTVGLVDAPPCPEGFALRLLSAPENVVTGLHVIQNRIGVMPGSAEKIGAMQTALTVAAMELAVERPGLLEWQL